jgi:hypothetical protein
LKTVVLRAYDNYFKANIILTRLQHSGIDCFLLDEYIVTIDPILSNAIGGIKLAVFAEDEKAAELLLQEFDKEYLESALCAKCGANDILLVPKPGAQNFISAILSWMLSSYAVAAENIYKCQQCGNETPSLPENTAAYN